MIYKSSGERLTLKSKGLQNACENFLSAMLQRLHEKEKIGYRGWDGKGKNSPSWYDLFSAIREDMNNVRGWHDTDESQKMLIDIANRCIMLWYRQEKLLNK